MNDDLIEKKIDELLTREPEFTLSTSFADRLIALMEAAHKRERRWEIFFISLVGLLFIIAVVVVVVLTDFKPALGGLSFLTQHIKWIAFGAACLGILQFLDRKLVHKAHSH